MQRFVQLTWKPTLAFMTLSWIITGIAAGNVFLVAVPALLLTPVVWWLMVGRRDQPEPRHGAIAGALAVVAAQAVPLAFTALWFGAVRPYGGGDDSLRSLNDRMAGAQIVGALAAAALGSVIGSLLARGRLPRV
jgi:hypothetical protein